MTYSDDTQYLVGIIESQDAVNDLVGGGTVGETAAVHLRPAGTQAQVGSLILYGNRSDGRVFYPTFILVGGSANHDGQGCTLEKGGSSLFGVGHLLERHLVVYHYKMPFAATFGCRRHKRRPQYELQSLGGNLFITETAMTASMCY